MSLNCRDPWWKGAGAEQQVLFVLRCNVLYRIDLTVHVSEPLKKVDRGSYTLDAIDLATLT